MPLVEARRTTKASALTASCRARGSRKPARLSSSPWWRSWVDTISSAVGENNGKFPGLPRLHGNLRPAHAGGHALTRAAILGILGVCQHLAAHRRFTEGGGGGNMQGILVAHDLALTEADVWGSLDCGFLGAEFHKGIHRQGASIIGLIFHLINHGGGILPIGHGHGAGDPHAADMIAPMGDIFKCEEAEVAEAILRLGAVGELLGGEPIGLSVHGECFPQPMHQGHPLSRSLLRRNQYALVTPVGRVGCRQAGIAAQPIGQQKAALLTAGKAAHFLLAINKTHIVPPIASQTDLGEYPLFTILS